jgi:hypothetical protein
MHGLGLSSHHPIGVMCTCGNSTTADTGLSLATVSDASRPSFRHNSPWSRQIGFLFRS